MSTFKKAKIVILPTNKKAGLGSIYKRIRNDEIGSIDEFDKIGNLYINKNPNVQSSNSNFEAQHLYIISDDEIKEGDWFYNIHSKIVGRAAFNFGKDELAKKIIATTDDSLGFSFKVNHGASTTTTFISLPQPSKQFIEKYIEEYNKGNIITDVLVEYEDIIYNPEKEREYQSNDRINLEDCDKQFRLKINPKYNTITIKKVKDSYTREEVIKLLFKCKDFLRNYNKESISFDRWIKENL